MDVIKIVTGQVAENCYILNKNGYGIIVDPGDEADKIVKKIEEVDTYPVAVILTHAHFDHIGALDEITEKYDIPVYIHEAEEKALLDPDFNLSSLTGDPFTTKPADKIIYTEGPFGIGPFNIEIRHTPGHSPGSVSYVFNDAKCIVAGDALFRGSIGRTDLNHGNHETLLNSIREKLLSLEDDYKVYPGHGPSTTIGNERKSNPFLT